MADCDYCSIAEKGDLIFEDDKLVVALSPTPASLGHVIIIPKEHITILEQIPDFLAGHLFSTANKISTSIFETMRVHGTNVIIENGISAGQRVAHFAINIIPRSENDGIGFNWQPKKLDEEEMSTIELKLKEQAKNIGNFETGEKKETIPEEHAATKAPATDEDEEDDSFSKQLERIP